jgi:hypothetical protein
MLLYNSCFQAQILIENIANSQELVLFCHISSTTTAAIPLQYTAGSTAVNAAE